MYDFDFRVFAPHAQAFLYGLETTLLLSLGASVLGTAAGLPIGGLLRLPVLRWLRPLNDVIRAIPVLVLMLLAMYLHTVLAIPTVSECGAAFTGLTIAQAVYTADVFRAAVDAMHAERHTLLAANALGLRRPDVWRFVILPDVMRRIFPTLVAFTIGNIHLSSLGATIGCQDVMWVAMTVGASTKRFFEGFLVVAAVYIVVVVAFGAAARRLERTPWLARHG